MAFLSDGEREPTFLSSMLSVFRERYVRMGVIGVVSFVLVVFEFGALSDPVEGPATSAVALEHREEREAAILASSSNVKAVSTEEVQTKAGFMGVVNLSFSTAPSTEDFQAIIGASYRFLPVNVKQVTFTAELTTGEEVNLVEILPASYEEGTWREASVGGVTLSASSGLRSTYIPGGAGVPVSYTD